MQLLWVGVRCEEGPLGAGADAVSSMIGCWVGLEA